MTRLAAWRTGDGQATSLPRSEVDLEAHLQDWLARDPSMLAYGLQVISRELHLDRSGRLDLLALDPQDRLLVIEIKRAGLEQEVLTQALWYAAWVAKAPTDDLAVRIRRSAEAHKYQLPDDLDARLGEPGESREVLSVVVGCGMGAGTSDLIEYLSGEYGVPIRAVNFEVFDHDDQQVLVREVTEVDQQPDRVRGRYLVEAVRDLATMAGVGSVFRQLVDTIDRHPDLLHVHPWPKSLMCAPAANKVRCLFTFWVQPDDKGRIKVWVEPPAFEEFLGVSEAEVRGALGEEYRWLGPDEVSDFLGSVEHLLPSGE